MFIVVHTEIRGGHQSEADRFTTHETLEQATARYNEVVAGDAYCAAITVPTLATETHWTDDGINLDNLLEIAQCLWENASDFANGPLYAFRAQCGTGELRSFLRKLEVLLACEEGWNIAKREAGFDDSFDWEFCPWFLRECLEFTRETAKLCEDWRERCAHMVW